MLHSTIRRHPLLPLPQLHRIFFATSTSSPLSGGGTSSREPHFMVEYLVNSCGLSVEEASKASKYLAHLRSTENPNAVLAFFRSQGIDGANLRKMISWKPACLCYNVESSLTPKFQFLRDLGWSKSDLVDVIMRNPTIIFFNIQHTLVPRLNVWENLFGSRELLVKNIRKGSWFLNTRCENVVRLNLNFLRDECDIPLERASFVLKKQPTFIVQNPNSLRALVDRAEGMGFTRRSRMFLWILDILFKTSREKLDAHSKLMSNFGWSNSEFCTAIGKKPCFLNLSTDILRIKMEFLIKDIGFTPSSIAEQPSLLVFSLKKRMIPRFQVMKIIKSEGLWTSKDKLHTFFIMQDPKFLKKYILPYKDKFPKLLEVQFDLVIAGTLDSFDFFCSEIVMYFVLLAFLSVIEMLILALGSEVTMHSCVDCVPDGSLGIKLGSMMFDFLLLSKDLDRLQVHFLYVVGMDSRRLGMNGGKTMSVDVFVFSLKFRSFLLRTRIFWLFWFLLDASELLNGFSLGELDYRFWVNSTVIEDVHVSSSDYEFVWDRNLVHSAMVIVFSFLLANSEYEGSISILFCFPEYLGIRCGILPSIFCYDEFYPMALRFWKGFELTFG
ncbi:hypothetical protein ZIOFF_067602 [Zingiber officinale]|uniref:Uncharacterized protein n=1 Tax=Zingiber officinale TaxID=94328 RepID=A0A8J5CB07_ZINOF|nr:hypothetical protein ZIOFF_067602 [Zingiber officinale]